MLRMGCLVPLALVVAMLPSSSPSAQPAESAEPLHRPFDQLLDLNVRDGLVYYRALRSERGRLDRYLASLNVAAHTYEKWQPDQKIAFWLNAYNAIVLQTVVNNYPIRGKSSMYPTSSIRQIPGAFEHAKHRVAGRMLTLDDIEKTILPEFKDTRLYLALGRGAVGSGRLRSEAYSGPRLTAQLASVESEFVSDRAMLKIDALAGEVSVTPIISWREAEFVAAYDKGAQGPFAERSAVERAILTFISPHLLRLERQFVEQNTFRIVFHQFDWRLNDLSGGRVD
jgi:Protein of unknown function, DUF547